MKIKKYIYVIVSFLLLLCSCKEEKQSISFNNPFGYDEDRKNGKYPLNIGNFDWLCSRNGIKTEGGPTYYGYWLPIGELLDTVKKYESDPDELIVDADVPVIDTVEISEDSEKELEIYSFDTCPNLFAICAEDLRICVETNTVNSNVLSRRVAWDGFNTILVSETFIFGGNSVPMRGRKFNISSFIDEAKQDFYETKKLVIDGKEYQVYSQFCGVFFDDSAIERIQSQLELLGGNPRYVSSCCDVEGNRIDCQFKFDSGATVTFVSAPYLFTNACITSAKGLNSEVSMRLLMHGFNVSSLGDIHSFNFYNEVSKDDYGYYVSNIDKSKKKYREEKRATVGPKDADESFFEKFKRIFETIWPYLLLMLPFVLKRRHRAIPVIDFYKNKTKDYVMRVGVLYFKEGDWQLILRKKITCFTFDLAEKFGIDISSENPADVEANASVLARTTLLDVQKMKRLIIKLNKYRYDSKRSDFNESVFNSVCDDINEVQSKLLNYNVKNKKI